MEKPSPAEARALACLAAHPEGVRASQVGQAVTEGRRRDGAAMRSQGLGRVGSRILARLRAKGWVEPRSAGRVRQHVLTEPGRLVLPAASPTSRRVWAACQANSSSEHAEAYHFCLAAEESVLRRLDEALDDVRRLRIAGCAVQTVQLAVPEGLSIYLHEGPPDVADEDEDAATEDWVPLPDGAAHNMGHMLGTEPDGEDATLELDVAGGAWCAVGYVSVKHYGTETHFSAGFTPKSLLKLA